MNVWGVFAGEDTTTGEIQKTWFAPSMVTHCL